jgi:hypothetical protein
MREDKTYTQRKERKKEKKKHTNLINSKALALEGSSIISLARRITNLLGPVNLNFELLVLVVHEHDHHVLAALPVLEGLSVRVVVLLDFLLLCVFKNDRHKKK